MPAQEFPLKTDPRALDLGIEPSCRRAERQLRGNARHRGAPWPHRGDNDRCARKAAVRAHAALFEPFPPGTRQNARVNRAWRRPLSFDSAFRCGSKPCENAATTWTAATSLIWSQRRWLLRRRSSWSYLMQQARLSYALASCMLPRPLRSAQRHSNRDSGRCLACRYEAWHIYVRFRDRSNASCMPT